MEGSFLLYGSTIMLSNREDFMYSRGFIDDSIYLESITSESKMDVMGAIFRVLPQSMHTVQEELVNLISDSPDKLTRDRILRQEEALDGEIHTNVQIYANFKDQPVRFGSLIQLEHIWTHKFLTFRSHSKSEIESENMRLSLEDFGTNASHFRIESFHKFQQEGDGLVRIADNVVLEAYVPEMARSAYIFSAAHSFKPSSLINLFNPLAQDHQPREVIASVDSKTPWTVHLYANSTRKVQNLDCGNYIWLTHSEEPLCLVAQTGTHENQLTFSSNPNDTNGLWKIEGEDERAGGALMVGQSFRLRHMSTGLYLSAKQGSEEPSSSNLSIFAKIIASSVKKTNLNCAVLSPKSSPLSIWRADPLPGRSDSTHLQTDGFYKIVNLNSGLVLHGSEQSDIDSFSHIVPSLSKNPPQQSFLKFFRSNEKLIWETLFLLACVPILRDFPHYVREATSSIMNQEFTGHQFAGFKKCCALVKKCIDDINAFVENKLKRMTDIEKQYGEIQISRQKLIKEQHLINFLVKILECAFSRDLPVGLIEKNPHEWRRGFTTEELKVLIALEMSEICKKIYTLLITVCKDNKENQNYAFQFFSIFQEHAGYGLGASKCMIHIMSNNEQILLSLSKPTGAFLERKSDNVINRYVWLLRKNYKERKPQLLELLKATCTNGGQGITINQERLHEYLFENPDNHSKAIITTTTRDDQETLYITLQSQNRLGEISIPLTECFEEGTIIHFHKDIQYFISMLELFAEMCMGRNYASKASIKDWFPLPTLIAGMQNEVFTLEARAAFAKLLMHMHIDSHPRELFKKPELIRVLGLSSKSDPTSIVKLIHTISNEDNINFNMVSTIARRYTLYQQTKRKGKVDEDLDIKFRGLRTIFTRKQVAVRPDRVHKDDYFWVSSDELTIFRLKHTILKYFKDFYSNKFDILSLTLLQLANTMARFDIFGPYCSDYEADRIVINPNSPLFEPLEMDLVVLLRTLTPLLFLKEISIDRISKRKTMNMSYDPLSRAEGLEGVLDDAEDNPVTQSAVNLKNFLHSYLGVRHSFQEEDFEARCLTEVLGYIKYYLLCREDHFLTNTIEWFNKVYLIENDMTGLATLVPPLMIPTGLDSREIKNSQNTKFKYYKKPRLPPLDLAEPHVVPKLLALFATTDSYDIQLEILFIVMKCYSQRIELFRTLNKLNTITSLRETDLFIWTKVNLNVFRLHSEQSEVWLKHWQQRGNLRGQSLQQFELVLGILKHLEYILYQDSHIKRGEPQPGAQNLIAPERQEMLRRLEAHVCVMNLIRDGMHTLQEVYGSALIEPREQEKLVALFAQCHRILAKFAYANSKNQKLLFQQLHLFTAHLSIGVQQIPLICEIFKNNEELCAATPDSLLSEFITLILNEGRQPRFLDIFELIQVVHGKPVLEAQRRVLHFFLDPEHSAHVLYMKDGAFDFAPALNSGLYTDVPINYHSKLLQVLASCGLGHSGVYLNELKCQKILPLKQLFALLTLAEEQPQFLPLRVPLLDFLYNNYLDTERPLEDPDYSQFFSTYSNLLAQNLEAAEILPEDFPRFFSAWVLVMYNYFKKFIENEQVYESLEDYLALKQFLESAATQQALVMDSLALNAELLDKLQELMREFDVLNDFEGIALKSDAEEIEEEMAPNEAKEAWDFFLESLVYNKKYQAWITQERAVLEQIVLNISDFEPALSVKMLLMKALEFIRIGTLQRAPSALLVNVIGLLTSLTGQIDDDELLLYSEAPSIVLSLLCEDSIDSSIFRALLAFSVRMLGGGNERIQHEFYQYFVTAVNSETFFSRMHKVLSQSLEVMPSRLPIYKEPERLIENCLRLLQLLCENHNSKLQNYIRDQEKARNSYDLVNGTVYLLGDLLSKKRFQHFYEIGQCFETLTEFCQGPCFANQKAIIDTKFLEYVAGLLSLDENSNELEKYQDLLSHTGYRKNSTMFEIKYPVLKGWMVSHLKLKCMITLHSLLEGNTDNYIITRMVRALNLDIFRANLLNIYRNYWNYYGEDHYEHDIFNHYNENDSYIYDETENPQDKNPRYYSLIIEVGFLIYHLVRKFKDIDSPEHKKLIESELPDFASIQDNSDFLGVKFIGEIGKLGLGIVKEGLGWIAKLAKIGTNKDQEQRERTIEEAYYFFESNTGSVEVIFPAPHICKVYFWNPPESKYLTEEIKESFHQRVVRDSDKTKLMFLISKNDEVLEEMHHEAWLNKIFFKYKLFALIASNVKFWRNLAFLLTLILNFMILTSYPEHTNKNEFIPDPILFSGLDADNNIASTSSTNFLFNTLGTIQVVCASIITFFFIFKKGPILVKKGWRKKEFRKALQLQMTGKKERAVKQGTLSKIFNGTKKGLFTAIYVLKSIHVLYHLMYMTFAVLALSVHYFFFAFHLTEIIYRYPALQAVIRSVIIPRKALILTFIWMLIIMYLFSLIGYSAFTDDFNENCTTLLMCLSIVFDQGFKADGGIGGYMEQTTTGIRYLSRFFFDNMYNIIVMIIMLNIVQGIIIDTFAILRQKHDNNTYDRQNKCFICGMKKEKIERGTSRPFSYHTRHEHNEWNYIYFIAYLKNKDSTDYTGIESSIKSQIDNSDIDWFPLNKAISLKDDKTAEENLLSDSINLISHQVERLEQELRAIKNHLAIK